DDEQRLARLFDALADSVEAMSDDEVVTEAIEEGDPKVLAKEVTSALEKAVAAYNTRQRLDARRRYKARVAEMQTRRYKLPASPQEQRALLTALMAQKPAIQGAVTFRHRDLKKLSDADIEGYLQQLIELGLLNDDTESNRDLLSVSSPGAATEGP